VDVATIAPNLEYFIISALLDVVLVMGAVDAAGCHQLSVDDSQGFPLTRSSEPVHVSCQGRFALSKYRSRKGASMQGNGADDYLSLSYAITEDARIPLSPRRYRNGDGLDDEACPLDRQRRFVRHLIQRHAGR
jgi:hypothetical protein